MLCGLRYIFFSVCVPRAHSILIEKRHCAYILVYFPSSRFFLDFENQVVDERCVSYKLYGAVKVNARMKKNCQINLYSLF